MGKFWTIVGSEYSQVVKKKSFLVGVLLTPAFLLLFTILPTLFAQRSISTTENYAIIDADGRGIGERFSRSLARYTLDNDTTRQAYKLTRIYSVPEGNVASIDSLRNVLDSNVISESIKYYIVIYPGVERSDSAVMVSKSIDLRTGIRFDRRLSDILAEIRLESSSINLPVDSVLGMARRIELIQAAPGGKIRSFESIYLGATSFVMIIFISVVSFGQILMRSVIEEKNSRVMEVLVSSVSPFQLMMGKIVGLGAANLTQIGIWIVAGAVIFSMRGSLAVPAEVSSVLFNPILIGFFILFLIIAYAMFSTLFAFVGSICTTDKETQNFVFPITMLLILPVILLMYIVQEPDSIVSVILSMIPVLTPTMMVARIYIASPEIFTFSNPIILEAVIAAILAILFTIFLIWVTSRIFRIGILMYGKRATLPEIIKWVRYK